MPRLPANRLPVILHSLREAAEASHNPIAQAIAGVAELIGTTVTDASNLSEDLYKLAEKTCDAVHVVVETLVEDEIPDDLLTNAREFQRTVENILIFMEAETKRSTFDRFIHYKSVGAHAQRHAEELSTAMSLFAFRGNLEIRLKLQEVERLQSERYGEITTALEVDNLAMMRSLRTESPVLSWRLPSRPSMMFGRNDEVESVVSTIVDGRDSARVAILGPGGIGKSSVALMVLHHPRMRAKFGLQQLFVPCDSASSAESLVSTVAFHFNIVGDFLRQQLLRCLAQSPMVIVLDNFESPWENPDTRVDVESLLGSLAAIKSLVIIITLRGAERPLGTHWTSPVLPVLRPLPRTASAEIFCSISGLPTPTDDRSDEVQQLLNHVDDIPLAVCLMANMAQYEPPRSLLQRWNRDGTRILDRGPNHRLQSLDISIQLTLSSSRIMSSPQAVSFLSVLSLFPDGITQEIMESALVNAFDAAARLLSILKQVALVYADTGSGRIRVLAPIREHVLRHRPPREGFLPPIEQYYSRLLVIRQADRIKGHGFHMSVLENLPSEAGNLARIIDFALAHDRVWGIEAATEFAVYMVEHGRRSQTSATLLSAAAASAGRVGRTDLRCHALLRFASTAHDNDILPADRIRICKEVGATAGDISSPAFRYIQGQTWFGLGEIYAKFGHYDKAEQALSQSLPICQELGDILGEAACYGGLGSVANSRGDRENALVLLNKCIELSSSFEEGIRQNIVFTEVLGVVYFNLNKFPLAAETFQAGLEHSIRLRLPVMQLGFLRSLGLHALVCGDMRQAQAYYQSALSLIHGINEAEEAMTMKGAAKVAILRSDFDLAHEYLESASTTFTKGGMPPLLGEVRHITADLALAEGDIDLARILYTATRHHWRDRKNLGWEALSIRGLGDVASASGDIEQALTWCITTLVIVRDDEYEVAVCLVRLGQVFLHQECTDDAISIFQLARVMAMRLGVKREIAQSWEGLGDVWSGCRGGEAIARALYEEALALYRPMLSKVGVEGCMRKLAGLKNCPVQAERDNAMTLP